MSKTIARYSKKEIAECGDAIYEREIRQFIEAGNKGKFVAIDIETGAFELDADEMSACNRLRERVPDPQIWLIKIGSRYVHRFGGQKPMESSQ